MIPLFAIVRVGRKWNSGFPLWIPLFLLWLVVLPVVALLSPIIFVICLACRVNPLRALSASWQMLAGLKGTHIEVNHRSDSVLVRIY